ncbi:Rho guanine nucleotide exchange factor [Balamuthia mandrillaris]
MRHRLIASYKGNDPRAASPVSDDQQHHDDNKANVYHRHKTLLLFLCLGVAALVVVGGATFWWLEPCIVLERFWFPELMDEQQCKALAEHTKKIRLLTYTSGFRDVWEAQLLTPSGEGRGEGEGRREGEGEGDLPRVVLKELKRDSGCGNIKAHFREVVIERELSHPNIVPFVGACNLGPPLYWHTLAQAYVSGSGTFHNLDLRGKPLAWSYAIMVDMARGLHYLHTSPIGMIVHDDLNWHQVLVGRVHPSLLPSKNDITSKKEEAEEGRERAYITDLNLATVVSHATGRVNGSSGGLMRHWWPKGGSWKFFAPEKLRLKEAYTEKVDIWSFGVLYYQFLVKLSNANTNHIKNKNKNKKHDNPNYGEEWSAITKTKYQETVLYEPNGWRPKRPSAASDAEWNFVERCWQFDASLRPSSEEVLRFVENFSASIVEKEAAEEKK